MANVKAISLKSIPVRLFAAALAGAIVLISVFSFVWGFASAASSNAEFKEVADLLARLSPSDPQTHFTAASLHEKALETGDLETALREYDKAAALAPHNYLLWLRLAATRSRAGETEAAEAALRRAEYLAPNYSRVQWAVGNFLLREGRDDEAYSELRKAVAGDPDLAPLAAATSLQMSDADAGAVSARFQDSPLINIALSLLLAGQKRFDEAVEIWNRTEVQNDEKYREALKQFRTNLVVNKKFAAAVSLKGQNGSVGAPSFEKITNGGFEQPVKATDPDAFDWKVTQGAYPQVGVTDSQRSSGSFSLIVLLGGQDPKEFRGPSQLVAVRPGGSYEFSVAYKCDVRTTAAFFWEVVSAKDMHRLSLSPALEADQNWSRTVVPFRVPADTDGVEIRFVRGECTGTNCSASGNFWFDDVLLTTR